MTKNITVFCSSKSNINKKYFDDVFNLISNIDPIKYNIVYGGGSNGLMGHVKKTFVSVKGKVISSNIHRFAEPDIIDDYVFTDIDDRQKKLVELGDIYLVLPGGYGTLFEALEVMTKNDIGEANKPIYILNTNNIYDNMLDHIDKMIEEGFITKDLNKINLVSEKDPSKLAEMINKNGSN